MGRGIDGVRVVLTRPEGRARELREVLEARGAHVSEVPLLTVVTAPDGGASLRAGLAQLNEGDWIALTSAAAVEGLLAAASLATLSSFRLAAVGEATAGALRSAGIEPALVGDGRGGGALAEQMPAPSSPDEPMLLALAAEPMAALGEGVRASGYKVIEATAYATMPRELSSAELETLRAAEVLVLSSPKGVRLAAAALGAVQPAVIALGPTTAAAAGEAGFTRCAMAKSPGTQGVLAAFEDLLGPA